MMKCRCLNTPSRSSPASGRPANGGPTAVSRNARWSTARFTTTTRAARSRWRSRPANAPSPAWRAWQLSGLTLAALSLAGYAVLNAPGSEARRVVARVPGQAPHLTLLLAGRDIVYCAPYTPCKDQDARKVWQPPNTDTIMLVKIDGTRVNVLSIPRDTNAGPYDRSRGQASQKINSQYWTAGLTGLSSAVEQITGERVDYTVVVRTDYAARVIGALGGLDVTVPDVAAYGKPGQRGIQFDDNAANLHVHLEPGPHHLDGPQGVAYLRMRKGVGDDYGRIDHQKQALSQLIGKLKTPAGLAAALPVILSGLGNGVDTNADAGLVESLTPALSQFRLNFATLPTQEIPGTFNLAADPVALARPLERRRPVPERYARQRRQRAGRGRQRPGTGNAFHEGAATGRLQPGQPCRRWPPAPNTPRSSPRPRRGLPRASPTC